MPAARVLIVDDSVVVRRLLSDIVLSDPELELAGVAPSASIALQKIAQCNPDVLLLDVEMPEMNGIEAAKRIRAGWPKLPIVMCSALTERGADVTLQALSAGASDYVAKPSSVGAGGDLSRFTVDVLQKLKALTGRDRPTRMSTAAVSPPRPPMPVMAGSQGKEGRMTLLTIGCSTGGPAALAEVLKDLPATLGVPLLIVQHMPPLFTRMLAERLTALTRWKVTEAENGAELVPDRAYIAPGNYHVDLVRNAGAVRIALNQDPPESSCRPAVDVTFRAAARLYGAGVLAAVLTGMGQDGTRGASVLAEVGATVVVQDAATCVVPSMPRSVAEAGFAHFTFPLAEMGRRLGSIIERRNRADRTHAFGRTSRAAP